MSGPGVMTAVAESGGRGSAAAALLASLRPPWHLEAACLDQPAEVFFGRTGEGFDPDPAKALCATCPALMACRRYALLEHIDDGVWGGLTPEERREVAALPGVDVRRRCACCDEPFTRRGPGELCTPCKDERDQRGEGRRRSRAS